MSEVSQEMNIGLWHIPLLVLEYWGRYLDGNFLKEDDLPNIKLSATIPNTESGNSNKKRYKALAEKHGMTLPEL